MSDRLARIEQLIIERDSTHQYIHAPAPSYSYDDAANTNDTHVTVAPDDNTEPIEVDVVEIHDSPPLNDISIASVEELLPEVSDEIMNLNSSAQTNQLI